MLVCILALNNHKGAKWHPELGCPKHLASVVAIEQWLLHVLEKQCIPAASSLIHVQLARDLGILLAMVALLHKEQVVSLQLYMEHITFLSKKWQ
jgi:hypothetical protein